MHIMDMDMDSKSEYYRHYEDTHKYYKQFSTDCIEFIVELYLYLYIQL